MMNAIAWDDEPDEMRRLASYLSAPEIGINLTIEDDEEEFVRKLNQGGWAFVITDLLREVPKGTTPKDHPSGAEIAQQATAKGYTVFILTKHFDRVEPGNNPYGIPPQAIIKSKSTRAGWLAGEIREDLRRRGLYFHHKKVFLIYGHDRLSNDAHRDVQAFLSEHEVDAQVVRANNLFGEIAGGLMERMNDCAAFVAVCTPDDKVEAADGKVLYQPRQNVLFEMGMAMGLNRGLKRLVILQRWGRAVEEQAFLPSDLGGVVPIRFERLDETVIGELRAKLIELQVDLAPPTKPAKKPKKP